MLHQYRASGRNIRLRRLSNPISGTSFMVPLDHTVSDGPIATSENWRRIIEGIALGGADAIIVHKGRVGFLPEVAADRLSIIIHLSGSTRHAPDANAKTLLADVEEAVATGADAVSLHINLGSDTENEQLRDFGRIAGQCARWSIPLLAMIYPRGPKMGNGRELAQITHAANVAADLGADLVKIPLPTTMDHLREVVAGTPVPVLVAGGVRIGNDAFLHQLGSLMATGVHGVAVGRNIFGAEDVRGLVGKAAAIIHGLVEQ